MILELAQNAVQYKMDLKESKLLGNYEYYYAAGFISACIGIEVTADDTPKEIQAKLEGVTDKASKNKERLYYLCKITEEYLPNDKYDGQMKELFAIGQNDGRKQEG